MCMVLEIIYMYKIYVILIKCFGICYSEVY